MESPTRKTLSDNPQKEIVAVFNGRRQSVSATGPCIRLGRMSGQADAQAGVACWWRYSPSSAFLRRASEPMDQQTGGFGGSRLGKRLVVE
jgi:hypothetical protein